MQALAPIKYYAGDTLEIEVTVEDADGVAMDLSGASARWAVAKWISNIQFGPALLTKTSADGITFTDAANGVVLVAIGAGELVTPGDLIHELEITLPAGTSFTAARGRIASAATILSTPAS